MRYWWFKNRLIPFLILFTLVNPDLTTDQPGPSNTETRPKRRKVVAHCKKCGFKADTETKLEGHACEEPSMGEPSEREATTNDTNFSTSSSNVYENEQVQTTPDETVDAPRNKEQIEDERHTTSSNRHKIVSCDLCGTVQRIDNMERHKKSNRCRIRCEICCVRVTSGLYQDHKRTHLMNLNLGFGDSSNSTEPTPSPFEVEVEEEYSDIYKMFAKYIKTKVKLGRLMDRFNFQVSNFSPSELVHLFKKVFRTQKNAFKVNLSMGLILQHKTSGEYRFNWSSQNNQLLFLKPSLIRNSVDKASFIKALNEICLINKVLRPNSEWIFVKVTNIEFFIYKMPGIAIGSSVDLPAHLIRNKGLLSLTKDKRGKTFTDKKCFFRCLALYFETPLNGLERKTNKLLKTYCEKASITHFDGIYLEQLEEISRIFGVPINVYQQDENRNTNLLYRTTLEAEKTLNLNLFVDHFSFIKDLSVYSRSFRCQKCDKIWTNSGNFHRHVRTCEAGIKEYYGNGTFSVKPTIYDELSDVGIDIPEDLRNFPYRATFDIECLLKSTDISTEKVDYCSEHVLVSVSVCSNVDGFLEPKCFVLGKEGDQKKLVKDMLDYLLQISETSTMLLRERYADFLDTIEKSPLQDKFESYIGQLPVLSFNGARYDLKVLKTTLIPVLIELDSVKFAIKKGTGYMVIATEELKFLDATYYIAPGFNYDSFLKAYGVKQNKSYFPYEHLDSLEKLDSREFPAYKDFYSSLKNCNTLEPLGRKDLTESEVRLLGYNDTKNKLFTVEEAKVIGQSRYRDLKNRFEENKWNIRDYLIYYNNLDVKPFIDALENMTNYYTERGVDVFKDAVSAPGIAERIAFQTLEKDETFFLFNNKNKDLVKLFRDNLVGGPALIFDRHQEAGKTKIRHDPDGPDCVKILGFDANALYLGCMAEECPCAMYVRRRAENGFVKEYPTPQSYAATDWLAHKEVEDNVYIQHARNGPEFKIGVKKIPVDGYCQTTNTVYQFHGCYYHGCRSCFPDAYHDRKDAKNGWKSLDERFQSTKDISEYIIGAGYDLKEMWECQWKELKKNTTNKYLYPGEDKFRLTEIEIIDMIRDGSLFGAIEVDIEVPENLKEKFSEMTPIFKNVEVTVDDIGDFMIGYLKDSGKKFHNTRYLIGSMFGNKILLITPLIKWYLEHGLVITKVHQVIQFQPKRCFKRFANQVSDDRRAGDADSSMAMIAETSKLLGNSVYGHSIMDKSKFTNVTFCAFDQATKLVNDPFFHSLDEFENETFEIVRLKKSVKYDLPLQLGYFVYQYAKLKMLSFYFDVVDRFIDRRDFSLLEMDTDSLYLALSATSLDEVIKPEMQSEWPETKARWFPRSDSPENKAYDKRTPGLFKLEWSGDGFVGLNAKTYYCYDRSDPKKDKHSSKGISRAFNLSKEDYLNVLDTKYISNQENRGFVFRNNRMYSYVMQKQGLTYFYCKRKLLANGLSTTYLDI